ncbi:MAG TPA: hypothetical protein VLB86_10575 [Gaiellaceae bacterium]|nr:hypothetical protein [Gaiellaceae bacterium]
MSTYLRLLELLDDGRWHGREEIAELTSYPDEWLRELELEGHLVRRDDGSVAVHRRQAPERVLAGAS